MMREYDDDIMMRYRRTRAAWQGKNYAPVQNKTNSIKDRSMDSCASADDCSEGKDNDSGRSDQRSGAVALIGCVWGYLSLHHFSHLCDVRYLAMLYQSL